MVQTDEIQEYYFDHAATSFPKPPDVMRAMRDWSTNLGASAGRGDYPRAKLTGDMIYDCRRYLAKLFGIEDPRNVILTANCTDALNLVIRGIFFEASDEVVVGPTEHNSVMRPLNALSQDVAIKVVRMEANEAGFANTKGLEQLLTEKTKLVALQHASNVIGAIHDIEHVANICRARGIPLLVDAAQTAGACPIDLAKVPVDF
ncbi:MAG: aminotransferase class V-fold PLP-dependent enzyme, partial [Candidatus Lindowbacteria bacterium]|nr:aminotransferase class V-fold PLP-dependent enzyme [Candidatus Lindowbacteria bacterium]